MQATKSPVAPPPSRPAVAVTKAIQAKFRQAMAEISARLIERNDEVALCLTGLIARENVLLVGPPGTAKSLLAKNVADLLDVGPGGYFEWQFSRFTEVDEIFGPYDLMALKTAGNYVRRTDAKLPVATVAFLDEALSLDTPIPTPHGWTTMGDIAVGDRVFGVNGQAITVTAVTPVAENHDCFRVCFRDGESIVADAGHKWHVRPERCNSSRQAFVMTTAEMAVSGRRYHIALPKPVELQEQQLPADPYVLGLWLGNGNNFNAEIYVRRDFCERTMENIRLAYPAASVRSQTAENCMAVTLSGTGFRSVLTQLDLIRNKHIPAMYLRCSIRQRLALLQGLMDTDGYTDGSGTCVFSNTCENLIDGVLEILRSFGIVASKKLTRDCRIGVYGRHKMCWKVTFRGDPSLPPFLSRQDVIPDRVWNKQQLVTAVEPVSSVPVRCITVNSPDHLYLAGANMVPTHNCFNASSAVLNSLHRLMNERTFDDGTGSRPVPLKFVVAASNIFPSAATGHENCEAAFDRFLLRREVQQVRSKPGRQRLLQDDTLRNPAPLTNKISLVEIEQAQKESASLPVAPETWVAIEKILEAVENEAGQLIMDRRIQKCVNACRAFAYLSGASEVLPEHLEILAHCLWVDSKMWRKVGEIVMRIANPMAVTIATLLSEADQVAATVDFGNRARLIATGNEAMVKLREIRTKIAAMRPPKGSNLPVNPRVLSAINMVDTMGKSLNDRIVKSSWVEESI